MNLGVEVIEGNLGFTFEWIVCIVLLFGSLIFMAKRFVLGVIINFVLFSAVFVWFYQAGYNWQLPIIFSLLNMIVLFLSLLFLNKSQERGVLG